MITDLTPFFDYEQRVGICNIVFKGIFILLILITDICLHFDVLNIFFNSLKGIDMVVKNASFPINIVNKIE